MKIGSLALKNVEFNRLKLDTLFPYLRAQRPLPRCLIATIAKT